MKWKGEGEEKDIEPWLQVAHVHKDTGRSFFKQLSETRKYHMIHVIMEISIEKLSTSIDIYVFLGDSKPEKFRFYCEVDLTWKNGEREFASRWL